MSARWSSGSVVAAAAVVLVLASACGANREAAARGGASSPPGAGQTSPAERSALPLTKEQLTAALLTAKDLPAGSTIAPSGGQDDSESSDPVGDLGCQKASATDDALYRGTRPEQVAHAALAFSTADGLGGGDESLSSFTTEAAASKEFSQYVAVADTCHSFGSKLGSTTAMFTGEPLSLPVVGDESRAYRYVGVFEGRTVRTDMMAFRVGGTLALLTAVRFGGSPESGLLERVASKAAAKLV